MALSDDDKWILAENLKRQEKREIESREKGLPGEGGDFGAYHALLKGEGGDAAEHAVSEGPYLASYARQLASLLAESGLTGPLSVLDVGCGPGSLTDALRSVSGGGTVTGIDISESAIAYAAKKYPDCRFEAVAVDEDTRLEPRDVVHAREFYPFTRTADPEYHAKYMAILARHVKPGGLLVLTLLDAPKSVARNADALGPGAERLGLTRFRRIPVAHPKLEGRLPLAAARAATSLAQSLLGKGRVFFHAARRIVL
jgi:SAM-dependent methyltransferase